MNSGTDVKIPRRFGVRSAFLFRCSMGLRSGLCAGPSSPFTPTVAHRVVIELELCAQGRRHAGTGSVPVKGSVQTFGCLLPQGPRMSVKFGCSHTFGHAA